MNLFIHTCDILIELSYRGYQLINDIRKDEAINDVYNSTNKNTTNMLYVIICM